jgi:DNA-binding NarL/FixJ family response regulator
MIKVLHIDDDRDHHELTKVQLRRFTDDITLEQAGSKQDALAALRNDVYDCIVTDDQVPGNDGVELLKKLRKDGHLIPFIVLSEIHDADKIRGFLEKPFFDDEFHVIVDYFCFDVLNYWIHRLVDKYRRFLQTDQLKIDLFQDAPGKREEFRKALQTLTPREMEILSLIGSGKSNAEIALELFISYKTVKNHVYNVFAKLGIHTRAEAIHLAISTKIADER